MRRFESACALEPCASPIHPLFSRVGQSLGMEKTLLRVVISILDGFHFNNAPAAVIDAAADDEPLDGEVGVEIDVKVDDGSGEVVLVEPVVHVEPSAGAAVVQTQRGTLPVSIHTTIVG